MKNLIFTALLIFTGCATGSHTLTGTARPEIPADGVKIYSVLPANSQYVGKVSSNSGRTKYAIDQIKTEAAKMGANGVVITQQVNSDFSGVLIAGDAIFVP